MPPVGFEPTISAGERPQTYPLDRAATGTGDLIINGVVQYSVTQLCYMKRTLLRSRNTTAIEYILQNITSYDPRHIKVLTYSEHKI